MRMTRRIINYRPFFLFCVGIFLSNPCVQISTLDTILILIVNSFMPDSV